MPKKKKYDALSVLDNTVDPFAGQGDALSALDDVMDFGDETNPYKSVKYSGKTEVDTKAELTELQKTFRENRKNEAKTMQALGDSNFWVGVIFESDAQCREFMDRMGFDPNAKFIDGLALAKTLNVKLTTPRVKFPKTKNDSTWKKLFGILSW